ncbi:MAG: 5-(carboxyamino)imidazole ribonucleotide mutase [Gammaproteobacteria bacterium]|nr:5-(carboxyamino)imidazole ribonucleotide mutase [Gammaproteobacteria bacterium]
MSKQFVAILMGSESDLPLLKKSAAILEQFNIPYELKVASAHRTPEYTIDYIKDAENRGCAVFIAAAGLAAHLAGCVAAHTIKPVIGVPVPAGSLNGLDALLSTVQMPGGVPVATVAIGDAGAKNAAFLAVQILALNNQDLANKILAYREQAKKDIINKNIEKIDNKTVASC